MMRLFALALTFMTFAFLAGCGEQASSGANVAIPAVYVNCVTAQCKTNAAPNPAILAFFTTSGCTSPEFGFTRSASTVSISCNSTLGCYGQISGWVDADGAAKTTIPSGTYSICVVIDYNHSYPPSGTGDTTGAKDNVAVADSTANQFVTTWTDL